MMKLQQLLQYKREDILAVALRHGAFNLWVFGSVARGEETESSDIDLLVDYDLQKISPWFPGGLLMDLQDMLGCKVDIVTEQGLSRLIKDRVLAESKSLVDFTLKEAV
jgi:Predicted nucleotidyltransferases